MVVCTSVDSVVIRPLSFLLHLFDYFLFSFLLIWLVVYFVDIFKKQPPRFTDFSKGFFVSVSPSVLL